MTEFGKDLIKRSKNLKNEAKNLQTTLRQDNYTLTRERNLLKNIERKIFSIEKIKKKTRGHRTALTKLKSKKNDLVANIHKRKSSFSK